MRNTKRGSWYIEALASVFAEDSRNTHVADMLVKVSGKLPLTLWPCLISVWFSVPWAIRTDAIFLAFLLCYMLNEGDTVLDPLHRSSPRRRERLKLNAVVLSCSEAPGKNGATDPTLCILHLLLSILLILLTTPFVVFSFRLTDWSSTGKAMPLAQNSIVARRCQSIVAHSAKLFTCSQGIFLRFNPSDYKVLPFLWPAFMGYPMLIPRTDLFVKLPCFHSRGILACGNAAYIWFF